MPVYQLTTPDGDRYRVTADSMDNAIKALDEVAPKMGIGYGRAAAQGALIDAPEALGSLVDLAAKVSPMMMVANAVRQARGQPPISLAAAGRGAGESLIGPRRQGTTGEEALATTVSGGVQAVPFMLGAGPLQAAAGVAGGALGNLGQFGVEQAGGGSLAGTGANVAINVAAALAARNAGKLSGLLTGGKAAETALEAVPVPKPTVVSAEDLTQGWVKQSMSDGSTVVRAPTADGAHAANVAVKTIPTEVRLPPGKAGNINLAMLDSPEGVKQMLRDTADEFGGFMEARRGVVPHAETERLAQDLGWTAEDLVAKKGRALLPHELEAGRYIMLGTGAQADSARAALIADPSPEKIAQWYEAFTKHVAVQEAMAGFTAETGRGLNILGKISGIQNQFARNKKLLELAGGEDRALLIAKALDEMPSTGAANKFAREAVKSTTMEKLIEAWKAGLLTGPQTHAVNFGSNALTQALTVAEDIGSGLGRAALGNKSAAYGVAGRLYGLWTGSQDALVNAYHALRTEEAMQGARAMETSSRAASAGAIGGRLGKAIRIPFRLLTASDQLFRTAASQSKLRQLAFESAYRGGARGVNQIAERANVLAMDPELIRQAEEFGKYAVFQKDLGDVAKPIQRALQSHPTLQILVPFYKTPVNIFKFALERTPGAFVFKEVRDAVGGKLGGRARAEALSRIGLGSMMMGAAVQAGLQGKITGSGPDEPAARAAWMLEKKPYSIKVGDTWYSYARLEPFASLLGAAADAAELSQYMTPKEKEHVAAQLALVAAHNFTNKTYVKGLTSALLAIFLPERYGQAYVEDAAASVVPNIITQTTRTIDPSIRETNGILDNARNRVLGMKGDLPARISPITGEPIVLEGSAGPDILSPIYKGTPANDPVSMEMVRLHMGIGKPDKMLDGTELSPQEYETLSRRAGELGHEMALRRVSDPYWKHLKDDEDRREMLRKVYDQARARARNELRLQRRREMKQ